MGILKSIVKSILSPAPSPTPNVDTAAPATPTAIPHDLSELPEEVDGKLLAYHYSNEICFIEGQKDTLKNRKYAADNIGHRIFFIKEPTNKADPHAVAVYLMGNKIGYVYRGQEQDMINGWLSKGEPIVAYISDCYKGLNGYNVIYNVGFYKDGGRTGSGNNSSLQSKKVNLFTKKWSAACRKQFIVLDFETTGFSQNKDKIIEAAAIKYENGVETDKFTSLVNPKMKIPRSSITIHHITDDMVKDAPDESVVIPQLVEFLSDGLIVGHNVSFDLRFLESAADRLGLTVQYNYIDTLDISRKLFDGLSDHKLGTVANFIGLEDDNMHRSETDARVCAEIIKIALDSME